MYDGRLRFVDQLERMGAHVTVCDPHRVVVFGPTPLQKASNVANDLRAGAALLVAALAAEGTSDLEKVELIDRGYENFDERLRQLGAVIEREEV
jgi:UDP-N-acetylglucosamine 1-carboxyvinyltransferase